MSELDASSALAADTWLRDFQGRARAMVERLEGKSMLRDRWQKEPGAPLGGQGESDILEGGAVFERAGVMFSSVNGQALPPSATSRRPELAGRPFTAMGVSIVIHPRNPYVPTSHMNVRALAVEGGVGWFGGGFDLTPYYAFDDDVIAWHQVAKRACGARYPEFKRNCDEYFFLKHRGEARGVGGVFFDDVDDSDAFALIQRVGDGFLDAFEPIVVRRRDTLYGERERDWQLYRRGRYVEFNLVLDRGTHFGLQSGGRTESILASMPPLATWKYDHKAEPGSPEAALAAYLKPRDWIS